jgi:hypothetical protein
MVWPGVRPSGPLKAERGALTPGQRRRRRRLDDLRHTAASLWLAAGADPKVVQRVLGHATAAMTMDLYGHLVDDNLWQAARLVGGMTGASEQSQRLIRTDGEPGSGTKNP